MQPNQQPPYESQPSSPIVSKKSIKLPIFLMVWPAASLVVIVLLQWMMMGAESGSGDLFGSTSPIKSIVNILTFLVGGLAVITGPISFIVGLVLVIKRKSA